MCKGEAIMTKNDTKKVVKKTVTMVSKVGRVFFGGMLIATHVVLNVVGALLCVVTKE